MTDALIKPGEITTREKMKEIFGGGKYQGIEPCKKDILIYTDPSSGEKHGYYDGWLPEEDELGPIFEYTGAGKSDQIFHGNIGNRNRSIKNHIQDGRTLRVFKADGKVPGSGTKQQRYIGEFRVDEKNPYVYRLARNDDGEVRRVIVFLLRPAEPLKALEKDKIKPLLKAEVLPVPASVTESSLSETEKTDHKSSARGAIPETTVTRREASLSEDFERFLEDHQHRVMRFQIRTSGLSSSLWTDLYDVEDHVLYEAKSSASREAIRMAIGQLMDYRRHIKPTNPSLAILLPERPHDDLVDLLNSVNISIVYRHDEKFCGWPLEAK